MFAQLGVNEWLDSASKYNEFRGIVMNWINTMKHNTALNLG